jgi:hypothetical protein
VIDRPVTTMQDRGRKPSFSLPSSDQITEKGASALQTPCNTLKKICERPAYFVYHLPFRVLRRAPPLTTAIRKSGTLSHCIPHHLVTLCRALSSSATALDLSSMDRQTQYIGRPLREYVSTIVERVAQYRPRAITLALQPCFNDPPLLKPS